MDLTSLYFSPNGRIPRKVYWLASLPLFAVSFFVNLGMEGEAPAEAAFLALIIVLPLMVPGFMLGIKRFHDRDKSGWFVLIGLIPVIGPIWLLVELGFLRGSEGDNRFGPDPLTATPDVMLA